MTISIIPKPQSMTVGEGVFSITAETIIVAADEAVPVAELLASLWPQLSASRGQLPSGPLHQQKQVPLLRPC